MISVRQKLTMIFRGITIICILIGSSACVKTCYSDRIAMAIARTTVINADTAINAFIMNEQCGFASGTIEQGGTIQVEGHTEIEPYGIGTITKTIDECIVEIPEGGLITDTTCNYDAEAGEEPVVTTAFGTVTLRNVIQTLEVFNTGMAPPDNLIPAGPDAISMYFEEVAFSNFHAELSNLDSIMIMKNASLTGTMYPRMAVGMLPNVCTIQSDNVSFADVEFMNVADVHVQTFEPGTHTIDRELELEIQSANLSGVKGSTHEDPEHEDFRENEITGHITIWDDESFNLPILGMEGDYGSLDPEYSREEYLEGMYCEINEFGLPAFANPLSFDCTQEVL